ncbi:MAG: type Z 30S ribosomal protein S14 [bacterium]
MARKALILKGRRKPKFSSRVQHRCKLCGRGKAYIRIVGMCRLCFREQAIKGNLPGITKASW